MNPTYTGGTSLGTETVQKFCYMLLISNIHIRQWNHLKPNTLHNGQVLCLDRSLVKRGDFLYIIKDSMNG